MCSEKLSYFFFFQAEDGIRDYKVTGVQTCALPILSRRFKLGEKTGLQLVAEGFNLLNRTNFASVNAVRSEEHTSELQSPCNLVCRLLLEKKKNIIILQPILLRNPVDSLSTEGIIS